ncbi:MAG: hypothetical protein LC105_05385 [Chitinophagales bacterium]|nr:hypothetical protein [Chitinophagales bacterium]MCZ2393267.1 hypothetical protein [Chitinophagales bacterium]
MNFLLNHLDKIDQYIAIIVILITLAEAIANLTPSEKDNSIILKIKQWFDVIIPNRAKTDDPTSKGRHEFFSRIIKKLKKK